mmetsp:Transcript_8350/g.19126  ORF Transcript_8350/g.19126 Transcript_8350/m.19126 type:complete len:84 (+) Transcript_8350:734-985(+)
MTSRSGFDSIRGCSVLLGGFVMRQMRHRRGTVQQEPGKEELSAKAYARGRVLAVVAVKGYLGKRRETVFVFRCRKTRLIRANV